MHEMYERRYPEGYPKETIHRELENIVGSEWVTDDPAICEAYSKSGLDGAMPKHTKDPAVIPAFVVLPESTEQVQAIVKLANRYNVPVQPYTRGVVLTAATECGTILMHLSRMDKILEIDEENMVARCQAFVNYGQLQVEAMKRGLWNGGTPLATALCCLGSQYAMAGFFVTELKYGDMTKNTVSVKCVTGKGDIIKVGSISQEGAGDFHSFPPGPNLHGLLRSNLGALCIITEITVKLYPWRGDPFLPEDIEYDRPPLPSEKFRMYWIEYPDQESRDAAHQEFANACVGIALNSVDSSYNAFYTQDRQERTEKFFKEKFLPPYLIHIVTEEISGPKQLEYEEKVIKHIASKTGGKILSEDYKPEVLRELALWNLESFTSIAAWRMGRVGGFYIGRIPPIRTEDVAKLLKAWEEEGEKMGTTHFMDYGSPQIYTADRGHRTSAEVDCYFRQDIKEQVEIASNRFIDFSVKSLTDGLGVGLAGAFPFAGSEHFGRLLGNSHLLLKAVKRAFDPNNILSPGRLVALP
jgi:hypothetical protein